MKGLLQAMIPKTRQDVLDLRIGAFFSEWEERLRRYDAQGQAGTGVMWVILRDVKKLLRAVRRDNNDSSDQTNA